jgi:hypothetical protein
MRRFLNFHLIVCVVMGVSLLGTPIGFASEIRSQSTVHADSLVQENPSGALSAPVITKISSRMGNLSIDFNKPTSSGGEVITNYSFSVDGGRHWIVRSPKSISSPIRIGRVGSGRHNILIRPVSDAGPGTPSSAYSFTLKSDKHPVLPIRFKSLKNKRGLILRSLSKKSSQMRFNIRALGSNIENIKKVSDSTEIDSLDKTGKLESAVISQTEPLNFDRIFIGPTGRTVATLGGNSANCSVAEISVTNDKSTCLATAAEAPLTNVELADQQISSMVPVKFDLVGNVYVSSFDSLLKISKSGQITYLVSLSDNVCVQLWRPLPHGGILAYLNDRSILGSCGGNNHTVVVSDSTGIVAKTTFCDCESVSIYIGPDDNAIVGDYRYNFKLLNTNEGTMTPLTIGYPNSGILRSFNQATLLANGRVIAIANNDWGRDIPLSDDPLGSPLIQLSPKLQTPDNIFHVPNVPVPFLLVPTADSKIVVAGLADPELCSDYSAVYNFEPQAVCPDRARLSVYDVATNTDRPIDLVNAVGGNADSMDIYFLSATPDGKQIMFAGRRSKNHFKTFTDVIGISDLKAGVTKIKPVSGFLGLSSY